MKSELSEKFLQRLKNIVGKKDYEKILLAIKTKPLSSFRTNSSKNNTSNIRKSLSKQGFYVREIAWYKDAFILENKSIRELTETDEYKKGEIYIQNLSSMVPALVLDPKPGEKILDICAAPGSKTTQLASMMQNKGEILANDLSRQRLYKLTANLKTSGVENTKVINLPAQTIWKNYPEYFDKTLVDVPCSMEGRIRLDDPKSFKDWSMRKIRELEIKQKYILRSAISATKVGGIIVYSTCTLAPEENEVVIDWILKKEGDAVRLEEIKVPKLKLQKGLTFWNKSLNPLTSLTSRISPTTTMEGFFIAKIRKLKSTIEPLRSFQR